MQGRRLVLSHLFASLLLGSLFGVTLSAAQDTGQSPEGISLRLSHGGDFLPRGTALVVLMEQQGAEPGTPLQPRFLAPDAYPLQTALVLRYDTLGAGGATRGRYPTTKTSGARYFIYARTPEGTVYWSYSALKDSIKFDTVSRGVMAVAPNIDPTAREQVIQTLFDVPATPVPAPAEAEMIASDSLATTAQEAQLSEATPPPGERAGILLPSGVFFLFLAVALAGIAGLLFLTLHYRARLAMQIEPENDDPPRFNAADWHPDRRAGLERELAEIKTNYERLKKTYNVLLARHKTLIREVQQLQHETLGAAQEPPKMSP